MNSSLDKGRIARCNFYHFFKEWIRMEKTKEGEVTGNYKGLGRRDKIRSAGKKKKLKKTGMSDAVAGDFQLSGVQQASRRKSHCKLAGKLIASGQLITFGRCFGNLFSIDSPVCAEECDLLCLKIDEVYSRPDFSHLENLNLEKGAKDICSCPDLELCSECGICNLLQAREVTSIIHTHP